MNENKLNQIIEKIVREAINEAGDLQPNNYVKNDVVNKWRVLFNSINNISNAMEITYRDNRGRITEKLYQDIIGYIKTTFDNMGISL